MSPDGETVKRKAADPAEAKTEALTPERRAELMAKAEAYARAGSGVGPKAKTGSGAGVRINSERHKVAPLDPELQTESGVFIPAAPPQATRAPTGGGPDATVALRNTPIGQYTSGDTESFDRPKEAGFESGVGDGPALEPTLPPQLDHPGLDLPGNPASFEGDATVAYMPDRGGLPPLAADITADDGEVPRAVSIPPPTDAAPKGYQPDWLASGRPVELDRPPGGAKSAFADRSGDISPDVLPAASPELTPAAETSEPDLPKTALVDMERELGMKPTRGWGCAFAVTGLLGLVGGGAAFVLVGPGESMVRSAIDWAKSRVGESQSTAGEGTAAQGAPAANGEGPTASATDALPSGSSKTAPTGQAPVETSPPPPAGPLVPVRFQLVDDVSASGYAGTTDTLKGEVSRTLKVSGPFKPGVESTDEGYSLSLWVKRLSVEDDGVEREAVAECSYAMRKLGGEDPPGKGTAREQVTEALPTLPADLDDDEREEALDAHEQLVASKAVIACGHTLAQAFIAESGVSGAPADPHAPLTAPAVAVPDDGKAEGGKEKRKNHRKKKKNRRGKRKGRH